MNETVLNKLELRLGRLHARQRLGIETDHEAQIFGQGINFFHIENWYSIHSVIRMTLKLLGLYGRGRKNAEQIQVRHNHVGSKILPNQFDGFTLLHISDLHADISEGAMRRLNEILPALTYDVCVLTGDYRGATFGPFEAALEGLARALAHLKGPVYGVLGNHDTIRMPDDVSEQQRQSNIAKEIYDDEGVEEKEAEQKDVAHAQQRAATIEDPVSEARFLEEAIVDVGDGSPNHANAHDA